MKGIFNFVRHLKTGLAEIAKSNGLAGENPKVTGSGAETFSLRIQDAWKYEFDPLIRENGRAIRQLSVRQNNT